MCLWLCLNFLDSLLLAAHCIFFVLFVYIFFFRFGCAIVIDYGIKILLTNREKKPDCEIFDENETHCVVCVLCTLVPFDFFVVAYMAWLNVREPVRAIAHTPCHCYWSFTSWLLLSFYYYNIHLFHFHHFTFT